MKRLHVVTALLGLLELCSIATAEGQIPLPFSDGKWALTGFDLGFSDTATVFLNDQPVYHGDDHFSVDEPRREGLMHYGQATLFLPLRAGTNELVVVVSDRFGGWGLMGRFSDARGLSVEPR